MLNGTFADDGSSVHMNEEMEVVDAIHCISDNEYVLKSVSSIHPLIHSF